MAHLQLGLLQEVSTQFTGLLSLIETKQVVLFINRHQENVWLWVAVCRVEDGASTERTAVIHIRRSHKVWR